MSKHITMEHFLTADRNYHVYRICHTSLASRDHHHDYFQLGYVICGSVLFKQEAQPVLLGPGDAFLIPPGICHSIHFESDGSEIYSLSFREHIFQSAFLRADTGQLLTALQRCSDSDQTPGSALRVMLNSEQCRDFCNLMECLIHQQRSEQHGCFFAAPGLIYAMVCILLQRHEAQPQSLLEVNAGYAPVLRDCIAYIDSNYSQALTADGLAKQFGLSKSVLYSLFPDFTGLSLHKYIAKKRIAEAQRLICAHPELQLGQIAAAVGYCDLSTFYRNFLRICGVSPSQYRNRLSK